MPLEPTDDPAESASENSSAPSARVARHSAGRSARQSAVRARRSYWPAALLGARVVVALLSIFVVLAAGYTWATFRSFTDNVTHINAIVKPTPTVTGSNGATIAPQDIDGTDENILLVGDDHRPANATKAELAQLGTTDDGGSDNTDTMMILHVPANGQRATIISLPRDSWVQIPGHGLGKLNAAFPDGVQSGGDAGGAQLLIATIQNMTGLTIDHFVRVSLLGFYDIANVLGPIKVCLNQPAEDSYSGVNLPAGVSQLNAQQALAFVRQRHNLPRGDLDREVRQQYFLSAAFRKVESAGTLLNPFKLKDLLSAVSSSLETDPGLDLLKFAQQFENLSAGNVTYSTIPITGTPTITYDGDEVSIVAVDTAAMPGFIARVVGPSTAYTKAAPAAATTVRLQVINATGQGGAAATATTALSQLGFQTAAPGDQMKSSITFIEYPAGMEAQAKALGNVVPGAAVRTSNSVSQVTLVLGSDGVTVNGAATATPSTGSPSTGSTSTGSTSSDSSSQSSSSVSSPARTYSDTDCIN